MYPDYGDERVNLLQKIQTKDRVIRGDQIQSGSAQFTIYIANSTG